MTTHRRIPRRLHLIPLMLIMAVAFCTCGPTSSYWGVDGRSPDGNVYYSVGGSGPSYGGGSYHHHPRHSKKYYKKMRKEQEKRYKKMQKERKKAAKRHYKRHHHDD